MPFNSISHLTCILKAHLFIVNIARRIFIKTIQQDTLNTVECTVVVIVITDTVVTWIQIDSNSEHNLIALTTVMQIISIEKKQCNVICNKKKQHIINLLFFQLSRGLALGVAFSGIAMLLLLPIGVFIIEKYIARPPKSNSIKRDDSSLVI